MQADWHPALSITHKEVNENEPDKKKNGGHKKSEKQSWSPQRWWMGFVEEVSFKAVVKE